AALGNPPPPVPRRRADAPGFARPPCATAAASPTTDPRIFDATPQSRQTAQAWFRAARGTGRARGVAPCCRHEESSRTRALTRALLRGQLRRTGSSAGFVAARYRLPAPQPAVREIPVAPR